MDNFLAGAKPATFAYLPCDLVTLVASYGSHNNLRLVSKACKYAVQSSLLSRPGPVTNLSREDSWKFIAVGLNFTDRFWALLGYKQSMRQDLISRFVGAPYLPILVDLSGRDLAGHDLTVLSSVHSLLLSGCSGVDAALFKEARVLKLSYIHIDMRSVEALQHLLTLEMDATSVSSLKPLARMTGLLRLSVCFTSISSLEHIAGLLNLRELFANNTSITSCAPLRFLSKLEILDISDTPITSVEPLSSLGNLKKLYIQETAIRSVAPLIGIRFESYPAVDFSLQVIYLSRNTQGIAAVKAAAARFGKILDVVEFA